jgi:hypothetical protein
MPQGVAMWLLKLGLILILAAPLAAAIYFLPLIAIRALAHRRWYWIFTAANRFAVITTKEDGGNEGNIVDIRHGIKGKRIDTTPSDPMNWRVVDGDDPRQDAFLYRLIGVQPIGFFREVRLNTDRRMRFAASDDKNVEGADVESATVTSGKLRAMDKTLKTHNVYYTGELTVVIEEADTADKMGINFEIDFTFEREYPVRSVLRLADSAAFLQSLVEKMVNLQTVNLPAAAYIGGGHTDEAGVTKSTSELREELTAEIENDPSFSGKVLDEIGFNIKAVSLRSVSMTKKHRELLELEVQARKKAQESIINAEADRKVKGLETEWMAERVEKVTKPAAENDRTVAVRLAEAYENNEHVTTYAPGSNTQLPLK